MEQENRCTYCLEESAIDGECSVCGWVIGNRPESALHLPPGTVLENKYLLGKVLGQGGFGITYLAWDEKLNLKLAIKEYLPTELAYRTPGTSEVTVYKQTLVPHYSYGLNKYLEEARTLARFAGHPGIVWVRDFFEANGTAYIVMEYVEGVTLKEYLAKKNEPLTFKQALSIFMPVLDALKEVHSAGILHRDISPDNMLIGNRGRVVLIDFGAARQAVGEQSRSMSVIMKAGFSPEEQYHSKGKQGPWTDIYATAASIYYAITGTVPPESLSRLSEDTLVPPTDLGIKIEPLFEKALLKALAVRAKDRYQSVDEFQELLIKSDYAVKEHSEEMKKHEPGIEEKKAPEKRQASPKITPAIKAVKKEQTSLTISKKTLEYITFVVLASILIFGVISLFGGVDDVVVPSDPGVEEIDPGDAAEEPSQTFDPAVIAALDADYYIDYSGGTIHIGDLPIGARVADPSWDWEFRTGDVYTGSGVIKPVTWIIVAKNHYEGPGPHVTLLSEELIGKHPFDNSTNRGSQSGSNHWGNSGTVNASRGLRPWLNSTGIEAGGGFYRAFSESFKGAVLTTNLPNKELRNGSAYSTQDKVFVPSTTELGDTEHTNTYQIGTTYPYFKGVTAAKRVARIDGETWWYWTRSPGLGRGDFVRSVDSVVGGFGGYGANFRGGGVRPALNLKSEILVSEISN